MVLGPCEICGRVHGKLLMDIAQEKPLDYFLVPEGERELRVKISSDLCSIDDERYFIRGYMPLPVHDHPDPFGWGLWAEVDAAAFYRYVELYRADGSQEPPLPGMLSVELPCYPVSTYRLPVELQLRGPDDRPLLQLRNVVHPLAREQREGITMARVHEIFATMLPALFEG